MSSDLSATKRFDTGAPAWVMTFADLMALLMCFFVLLLSFSEMDVLKFKQFAGTMRLAFGVNHEVSTEETREGGNVITRDLSPSRPDAETAPRGRQRNTQEQRENWAAPEVEAERMRAEVAAEARVIREALRAEMENGLIDVEAGDQRIVIRIREKGSFPSGTAELVEPFAPVLVKLGHVLSRTEGRIVIAGHTDNVPISTARFRSNWELSAARSVTVLHELLRTEAFDPTRFLVEGHADSRPLESNDTPQGRARNRRVELIIDKDEGQELFEPPPSSELDRSANAPRELRSSIVTGNL